MWEELAVLVAEMALAVEVVVELLGQEAKEVMERQPLLVLEEVAVAELLLAWQGLMGLELLVVTAEMALAVELLILMVQQVLVAAVAVEVFLVIVELMELLEVIGPKLLTQLQEVLVVVAVVVEVVTRMAVMQVYMVEAAAEMAQMVEAAVPVEAEDKVLLLLRTTFLVTVISFSSFKEFI
jgi:hypothetical protein